MCFHRSEVTRAHLAFGHLATLESHAHCHEHANSAFRILRFGHREGLWRRLLDEAQAGFCYGAKPKARHHRFALFGTLIDGHPNLEGSEVAARRRSGMWILQGWERHESLVGVCIV